MFPVASNDIHLRTLERPHVRREMLTIAEFDESLVEGKTLLSWSKMRHGNKEKQ